VKFAKALKGAHVRSAFDKDYRMYIIDGARPEARGDLEKALHNHMLDPTGYGVFERRRKWTARQLERVGLLDPYDNWAFADSLRLSYSERVGKTRRHLINNTQSGALLSF
jgi:hypothetical protein